MPNEVIICIALYVTAVTIAIFISNKKMKG